MDRRTFLTGASAVGITGFAGCTALGSGEDDYDIGMTAVAYRPPSLTVEVGDTVVWKNTSARAHTVTAYDDKIPDDAEFFATGGFESQDEAEAAWDGAAGAINSGETYEHTFEVSGNYQYFCIPHEKGGMVGTIVVE
jgi:plastocyanin